MKRVSALVCAMIVAMAMMAPACLATTDTSAADPGFVIVSSSPQDGDEGVAVDNFSVKICFSKEMMPKSEAVRKSNAAQFTLVDEDGTKIPLKVYYSEKERKRGLMMVAADYTNNNAQNVQIKGATRYILTIGDKLQASDGSTYNQTTRIQVSTLNQQRSMMVYMILMVAMMGGMIFFTVRSTRKAEEKKQEETRTKGANPYKEAKRTGKSVEEIVAKNQKQRNKQEEARARQKEREAALEAEILEKMRREKNKRVKAPAPISAVGSTYKVQVRIPKKEAKETSRGTTNPKNQSGKKKNAGKSRGKRK